MNNPLSTQQPLTSNPTPAKDKLMCQGIHLFFRLSVCTVCLSGLFVCLSVDVSLTLLCVCAWLCVNIFLQIFSDNNLNLAQELFAKEYKLQCKSHSSDCIVQIVVLGTFCTTLIWFASSGNISIEKVSTPLSLTKCRLCRTASSCQLLSLFCVIKLKASRL